jgi:hypothetical protein
LICASTRWYQGDRCEMAVQFIRPATNGMSYGRVYNKCKKCKDEDEKHELQVAMIETDIDVWEKYRVEPERGDAEACNAAVAKLISDIQRFEYFVGILNRHYSSVFNGLCVCEGCDESRKLRKENGAWRLYDHCCAPDDEKKKHAKADNESWAPFTKFTPTDEGWKIQRREATDAQKETKKNELKYVGTVMP